MHQMRHTSKASESNPASANTSPTAKVTAIGTSKVASIRPNVPQNRRRRSPAP